MLRVSRATANMGGMKTHKHFKSFYASLNKDEIKSLADRAGTSPAYLWQISDGRRKPGASISARLKAADNRITDNMLRPDLYGHPTNG